MKAFLCGVVLAAILSPVFSFGQKGFSIGAPPAWVDVQQFSTEVPDTADFSGYYYLFNDYQENAEEKDSYVHTAIKVINDRGLSYASSWDWSYDPSFEKMTFHSLYILRGKQKIDHLSRNNFEIIQREENLSRASYDGSLSVIVNLKDVIAGDVIVFSYSRKGRNPVFKDHYFNTFYFSYGSPIGKISCRLLADQKRKLQFKEIGKVPERKETTKGSLKVYSWEVSNVPSVQNEDMAPSWMGASYRVQVSDFSNWEELWKWSVDLFKVEKSRSKELAKFIDSLKSMPDTETRMQTAIKTIQDKVRYFSFVDGMSAYRPHNPSKVFDNKYGDCKDKSLLLSEIFNEIGIESHPLLVSTTIGRVMDERLPSPWNFDHCIVQYKYNDSLYYLDPTISFQRGSIKKIVTPNYYYGVVADEQQPGLTKIPETKNWSVIRAKEEFEVIDIGGAARLKVETYYSGSEADNVRDGFKAKTKAEINKDYTDFYANEFPEIKIAKSISYSDDTVNNAVTVFEQYDIPNFWKYDSAKSHYAAETYGRVVSSYLVMPSTKARHTPFTIRYPLDVQLITTIRVPEDWNVDTYSKKITGPAFEFNSKWGYADHVIRLQFDLHNTAPIVEPSRTTEYVDKVNDIYNELSFQITHTGNSSSSEEDTSTTDGRVLLLIIAVSAILFVASKRLYYFNPRSRQLSERHDRIGRWLLLPAIGITISPFAGLYYITSEWVAHRTIFADSPFSIHKVILVGNLVSRLIFLALASLSAILFWNRRTSAPYFITATYAMNLLIVVTDVSLAVTLYDTNLTNDNTRNLAMAIVVPAIWVPYFLFSERARGTFTQRLVKWRDERD